MTEDPGHGELVYVGEDGTSASEAGAVGGGSKPEEGSSVLQGRSDEDLEDDEPGVWGGEEADAEGMREDARSSGAAVDREGVPVGPVGSEGYAEVRVGEDDGDGVTSVGDREGGAPDANRAAHLLTLVVMRLATHQVWTMSRRC